MRSRKTNEKEPIKFHRYESDMTRREKRELEKQKLSEMSLTGKLAYIWTYYKPHMAAVVGIIAAVVIICQLVENSKYYTILNVSVINASMQSDSERVQEELLSRFGTGDKYEKVVFDSSFVMGKDVETADYNMVMKFTTVVAAKDMDILITSPEFYEHYKKQDMFLDLSTLFTEEECSRYGISGDTYRLDITDTDWLQNHKWVEYEPVYLAVIANTGHQEKIKEFITAVEEEK
ncbi:hypothetical protein [Novisyntrophococcus fermenticellae]|uniref:hypothetical protein n=1 Tax=Novisyntrophococcus fermenticellae TaxID=2068655 RepID=UPI001E4E2B5E|nr:hypothetical protein [Novisyntrophococcus fermenticellae]